MISTTNRLKYTNNPECFLGLRIWYIAGLKILPFANSFGWFLDQNVYLNASSNSVPPFLDPISSGVHAN